MRMLSKKPWMIVGGVSLILLASVLIVPTHRLVLLGLLRGEKFYLGHPTCYWHQELCQYSEDWGIITGDWSLLPRKPTTLEGWLERLVGFKATPNPFPLFKGDPAALPVLVELLDYPDFKARRAASRGLHYVGPAAKEAAPALVKTAQTTPDYALYQTACDALRRIDPGGLRTLDLKRDQEFLSWELLP